MPKKIPLPRALALASVLLQPTGIWAQEVTYSVELKSQPLSESLKLFADQTGLQVMFFSEVTDGVKAVAISGDYTAKEVLDTLLAGSGLVYEYINEKAVTVRPAVSRLEESSVEGKFRPAASQLSEAQGQTPAQRRKQNQTITDDGDMEQIVVTGTRLNTVNPASPVVVVDREAIERGSFTTVEDVFRRLPQSLSSINASTVDTGNAEFGDEASLESSLGASSINLRGLGSRATLVLVNGRRRTGSAQGVGLFTDISSIPLSQVERIEILTDGATAIYGADAVAGVVNIILRDDYDGGTLQFRHESSSSNADLSRLSGANTFQLGNGFLTVSGDYAESDPANTTEFIHSGPTGMGDFTGMNGFNNRTLGGQPGIVYSWVDTGSQFFPAVGDILGLVPAGQDGTNLTLTDLGPIPEVLPSTYQIPNIGPEVETASLRVNGEFELADSLGLQFEAGYTHQENAEHWAPRLFDFSFLAGRERAVPVPESNPLNRFGEPVLVAYSFDKEFSQMRLSREQEQDNYDLALYLNGDLPVRDWNFTLGISASREESQSSALVDGSFFDSEGNFTEEAMQARLLPVLNRLNVFTDGSDPAVVAANAALMTSLVDARKTQSESEAKMFDGHVSGSLFELPAGEAQFALGFQVRRQNYEQTLSGENFRNTTIPINSKQDSEAVFMEVDLPLISDKAFFHQLNLSFAARHERFDLSGRSRARNFARDFDVSPPVDLVAAFGADSIEAIVGAPVPAPSEEVAITRGESSYESTDPQVRLAWRPTPDLLLRSTWGESYLVPQALQQFGGVRLFNGLSDFEFVNPPIPLPEGVQQVIRINGANANLDPQEATTFTYGFDYTPSFLPGSRFSATYSETDFEGYIASLSVGSNILRDLAQDFDTFLGSAFHISNGVLVFDARQQNLSSRLSRTVDINTSYQFDTGLGNWLFELNAVRTLETSQQATDASTVEVFSNTENGPSNWVANFAASWSQGNYGVTSVVYHSSDYEVVDPFTGSFFFDPNPNPRRHSSSYTTWDLQFRYNSPASSGWLKGLKVQLGAQNLLDADFPFVDNTVGFNTNRVNVRGRVFYLDLRKDFGI